jgi:hypothetical protein
MKKKLTKFTLLVSLHHSTDFTTGVALRQTGFVVYDFLFVLYDVFTTRR